MTTCLKLAALLLPVGVVACGSPSSVQHTNEATTERLDVIANNTGETDGRSAADTPMTPDEVGQSIRAGATKPPQR